ncbi:DUF3857 domain-containing transglutaminase family protein [Shewanella zhangzhouensis]|uniref:DUF3857 domain-containing transglutaminase family protein n=1 Tax=Shewanella zhangzhouensis TaxID=2864213 RepID=UPI001C6554AA|nr:DUF3857 domain-containing protein [Shewanella zhangzhouensis]QYK04592.1 DUF3857 and transglutaminase domain-containing protein [Shewanella zhangzhouensis]
MNRWIHFLLVAGLSALLALSPSQAKTITSGEYSLEVSPAPDWATHETLQALPAQLNNGPSHFRLVSRQVLISPLSDHYFLEFAALAANHQGVKELSKLELTFNPAFESMKLHSLQVERNGVVSDRLETARINIINQEPELVNDLFHGLATAVVVVPDLRVGDTLRYSYSLEGRNPVYGKQFGGYFQMGWEASVDLVNLGIINASGVPLQLKLHELPPATESKGKYGIEYHWRQTKVPRYSYEEGAPADVKWSPYVTFSSSDNWAAIANWASGLYQFDNTPSPALTKYVNSLRAMGNQAKQIEEIVRFVQQDIRYFGIEMGQSSHVPHTPNQVFERRYGDCKDKANLMNFLLSNVGIDSYPALVNTRSGRSLPEQQPSGVLFDHVINLVEFNGKHYWIDGTNHVQAQGLEQLTQPDFGYALVLRQGESALTAMPQSSPAADRIDVEQSLIASGYDGPVDMYVVSRYRGKEADRMRYQLQGVSTYDVEQHYLNYYAKLYPGIRLQAPVLIHDSKEGRNEILLREQYQIDNFWNIEGKIANFSMLAFKLTDLIQLPSVIQRTQPMAISGPVSVNHTIRVSLPQPVQVHVNGEDLIIDTPSLAYRSSELGRPGTLIRQHSLVLKQDRIPAAESAEYVDALKKIDRDIYYTGTAEGDFTQPSNPGIDYLEQHLNTGTR